MIEEFIKRQFKIRDVAHRAHWGTPSGYVHETLGGFYDGVIEQADTFVEAYVAATREKPKSPEDAAEQIRAEMLWLAKHREELARGVPALENLVDEVSKFYLGTLFKLENLK
jgi:DNA-binding ferritin-like protein